MAVYAINMRIRALGLCTGLFSENSRGKGVFAPIAAAQGLPGAS